MTTAAAAAALPREPEPEVRPERLIWIDVESAPEMTEFRDGVGDVVGWAPVTPPGLTDRMAEKLREVCDLVDQFDCEANGCTAGPNDRPAGIGWGLAGDADERTEWRWVALVQYGRERVVAVCEDCSPTVVYDALFQPDEE